MPMTPGDRVQIWSSGGGTQSAAIAALIVSGRLPRPDFACISDTGYEQQTTWDYCRDIVHPALLSVGVILHRISAVDYATVGLYGGKNKDSLLIPAFTDKCGDVGKLPGYCSNEWKRRVVQRWVSAQSRGPFDMWLGISVDETRRAKQTNTPKWKNRWPLIELGMHRQDCVDVVRALGWPTPPRSSCYMCPNHTQDEWRNIRDNSPGDWQRAIRFERAVHKNDPNAFLHPDAVPLDQANLDDSNAVFFGHECQTGHCFV